MQPQTTTPANPTHSHPQTSENDNKLVHIRSPVKSNFIKRRTSKPTYGNENTEPNVLKPGLLPESNTISTTTENKNLAATPSKSKSDFSFADSVQSSREHNLGSKPAESPYTAFCRGLQLSPGPLPSVSPITYGKSGLFFGGNELNNFISPSPLNLHIGPDNGSSPVSSRKHITKLDFGNKLLLFKNNRDEISIEQEDPGLSPSSPKFNFPVKKSIYTNTSLIPTNTRTTDIFSQSPTRAEDREYNKDEIHAAMPAGKPSKLVADEQHNDFDSLKTSQKRSSDTLIRTPSPSRKLYLDAANSFTEKGEAQPILQSGESLGMQKRQSIGTNQQNLGSEFNTAHSSSKSSVGKVRMEEEEDADFEDPSKDTSASKKKVCCNCKKSRCLKLYCDCFARGTGCTKDCNCQNCLNNDANAEERQAAMANTLERNPIAFKPKVNLSEDAKVEIQDIHKARHIKGCNCKKSGCLKKYCECYQAGAKCSDTCKCEGCKNMDPIATKKKPQSYGVYTSGGRDTQDKSSVTMESPSEIKENARNFLNLEHVDDENSSLFNDSDDGDDMKKHLHPRKQLFTNLRSPRTVHSKKDDLYVDPSEVDKQHKSGAKGRDKKRKGSTNVMAPPKTPTSHSEAQKKLFEYTQSPEKQQSLSGGRSRRNIRPFSHLNPDEYDLGK